MATTKWLDVTEDRSFLELMPHVACRRHLAQETVGRVAVVVDGYAEVFPVNYVMDGDGVVFRTNRGTKLAAIDDNARVTFQIDGVDLERKTGWSVQVRGRARWVSNPEQLRRLRELPLEPWAHGDRSNFVRIIPMSTSGRRIHPAGIRREPTA